MPNLLRTIARRPETKNSRSRAHRWNIDHVLLRAPKKGHSVNTLSIASGFHPADRARHTVKTAQKKRVQLDFAPKAMERLNALKAKTEAPIEETESGKQFTINDKAGTVAPFRLFF